MLLHSKALLNKLSAMTIMTGSQNENAGHSDA